MKNNKIIEVELSESFMSQYGLMWNEAMEEGKTRDAASKPSAKPNYNAMAKISGKDKQTVQVSLNNMFQLIGELLSESGNIEVNLGALGKFSSINRSLIYSSMNPHKPSALHGYQTVKGLMDLGHEKTFPKGKPGKLDPLGNPSNGSGYEESKGYSQELGGQFSGSFKSKTLGITSSPTRRFKKPRGDGKIINTLLSAGDNPEAKDHEFSMMASDAASLMSHNFSKPGRAMSRFPPVIDSFSRTLAAPISSLRHYLSVSHRIGTNFTPSSKGYYIDIDHRSIKYKNIFGKSKLFLSSDKEIIEPADELEEYESLMKPDSQDEERIIARKNSYIRYMQYIDEEIPVDVIAPIRVYWINHILELIPADLHAIDPSRVTSLVDEMLKEMNENYYNAVKKSILDYILKDENEMKRLEIYQVLNCPIDWGDNYYTGIEPEEEWKQNVMMARMLMSENLCICSQATLSLMSLWQDYENLLFVSLPGPRKEPVSLETFTKAQHDKAIDLKTKLSSEWNKKVVDILRKELESMDGEQTKTFFESVGTLMANQVRDIVTKSIDSYVDFFERFRKGTYPTPKEIIKREYDPDTPFEDNFLTLRLVISGQNISFENRLHDVQKDLTNIVEQIVNQSQNLPRPENTISKAEKMHLWAVQKDDEIVKIAKSKIEDIIEQNINVVEQCYSIYDEFIFILKEDARLEDFASKNQDKDAFIEEINKYKATIERIKEELPFEIRMNMFLIDCNDLKNELISRCEDLINKTLDHISKHIILTSNNIQNTCRAKNTTFQEDIKTPAKLVEIEREFEKYKDIEKHEITNDYMKVVEWLMTLNEYPSYKASEDEIKPVVEAYSSTRDIERNIDKWENDLKDTRLKLEQEVKQQRIKFIENLEEIKKEIEDFKEYREFDQVETYTEKIEVLNNRLAFCETERLDINKQEETLEFEITEFDQVTKLQTQLKPFDSLWNLVAERQK